MLTTTVQYVVVVLYYYSIVVVLVLPACVLGKQRVEVGALSRRNTVNTSLVLRVIVTINNAI